jgi:hypothetical protein
MQPVLQHGHEHFSLRRLRRSCSDEFGCGSFFNGEMTPVRLATRHIASLSPCDPSAAAMQDGSRAPQYGDGIMRLEIA